MSPPSQSPQSEEKMINTIFLEHRPIITSLRSKRAGYIQSLYQRITKHLLYHTKPTSQQFVIGYGSIYFVDLGVNIGSEQNKLRPCLVISKKRYNNGNTVTLIPLTSSKPSIPCVVPITPDQINNLTEESRALIPQIRTISKKRIVGKIGIIDVQTQETIHYYLAKYLCIPLDKKTPHEEMSL